MLLYSSNVWRGVYLSFVMIIIELNQCQTVVGYSDMNDSFLLYNFATQQEDGT